MPTYNYECLDCLEKANVKFAKIIKKNGHLPIDLVESEVLYETSHPMNPTTSELHAACECPRCGSHNAQKTYHGTNISGYIRGYGYLDKKGCHRDMNRYKLTQADPYAEYRQPGEVEHIKDKLNKSGTFDPKPKHFVQSDSKADKKEIEKAVSKATSKN